MSIEHTLDETPNEEKKPENGKNDTLTRESDTNHETLEAVSDTPNHKENIIGQSDITQKGKHIGNTRTFNSQSPDPQLFKKNIEKLKKEGKEMYEALKKVTKNYGF